MNINGGRLIRELEEPLSTVADALFNSAPRPPLKADHLSACLPATPFCDGKKKPSLGNRLAFISNFFFTLNLNIVSSKGQRG